MNNPTYVFLDYELDLATQVLTHRGTPVRIRPKTLAILCYLIANSHRVVTKDELLDSIWPDVDVQDQAVFQSISELRSLLAGHDCIETVRGRGYRWNLPLRTECPTPRPRSLWRKVLIPAGVFAIVATFAFWPSVESPPPVIVVVNPVASMSMPPQDTDIAPSMAQMLIQQLREMGWNVRRRDNGRFPAGALEVDIDLESSSEGLALRWALHDDEAESSGLVESPTPLGAVRDLAAELHESLSLRSSNSAKVLFINEMFAQAKKYIDIDDYKLAESYLNVILAEQPGHLGAQMALAYTYQQTEQYRQAVELGYSVHSASLNTDNRAERMMSAILLSQVLATMTRYTESEQFAREALELGSTINDLLVVAEAQEQLGEISLANGQTEVGIEQLGVALQYYSTFCPTGEARVTKRLHELELSAIDRRDTTHATTNDSNIG